MRTAGIAFRREGILDLLEGKVLGVGGRSASYWVDTMTIDWGLEAKYSLIKKLRWQKPNER